MDADQLRELITDVLDYHGLYSPEATELLMLTAAQESHCGRYIKQVGGGPALGIFQMEPASHRDLWDNFLIYRDGLAGMLREYGINKGNFSAHLRGNIPYQIIVARLFYYRFPEAIPSDPEDIKALACYYKKYWNTEAGKATIEEALRNYRKYAI